MLRRTRKEKAAFVTEAIRSLGIRIHPSSRIAHVHRLMSTLEETVTPGHPDFEALLEADRDMQILELIFSQPRDSRTIEAFTALVKLLTDDSILPQLDRQNSDGRNTQFHLFVAALCHAAGLGQVTYDEPDVVCEIDGISLGIAAKRIKSARQAEKHIRKAFDQIERTGKLGIVAIDLTIALNPSNVRLALPAPEREFMELQAAFVNRFLTILEPKIRKRANGGNVLGLVVHDSQLRLEQSGNWTLSGMTIHMCTTQDQVRQELFDHFFNRYSGALPNMIRL